jgi:hypothetical protein
MKIEEKITNLAVKKQVELYDILREILYQHKVMPKNRFLYLGDIVDLIKYYEFVIENDYKKAYQMQNNLDTDVYEKIPSSICVFVQRFLERE